MTGNPIIDFKVPLNSSSSSLASAITSGAGSLTVATGDGANFPATADGDFWVSIDSEILLCTARTADVLTVTRAQQSTAAASHDAGAAVELRITQEAFEDIHSNIVTGILQGWVLDDAQNPSLGTLPARAFVTAVDLWVEEAFDDTGTDLLTVGYDAVVDAYVASISVAAGGLREHITEAHGNAGATLGTMDATSRAVEAYYTGQNANAAAGKAYIVIHYIVATAEPA